MDAIQWEQGTDWAAVAPLIQARQHALVERRAKEEGAPQRVSALVERLKLERLGKEQQLAALAPTRATPQVPQAQAETPDASGLTEDDAQMLRDLKARDSDVRRHERAHAAVGGQFAGQPTYTYQIGPDGQRYAIGGAVSIDVSPVDGDPAATIQKMDVVKAAALAPAEPSSADRQVAAMAAVLRAQAIADLAEQRSTAPDGVDRRA